MAVPRSMSNPTGAELPGTVKVLGGDTGSVPMVRVPALTTPAGRVVAIEVLLATAGMAVVGNGSPWVVVVVPGEELLEQAVATTVITASTARTTARGPLRFCRASSSLTPTSGSSIGCGECCTPHAGASSTPTPGPTGTGRSAGTMWLQCHAP